MVIALHSLWIEIAVMILYRMLIMINEVIAVLRDEKSVVFSLFNHKFCKKVSFADLVID